MRSRIVSLAAFVALGWCGIAFAIPTLQLDIGGGVYDPVTQSIVTDKSTFTLYALLYPEGQKTGSRSATLAGQFYLSAAVTPKIASGQDLGSFSITGPGVVDSSVAVTGDMTYGSPPIDTLVSPDLPGHGIFETYFVEVPFRFSSDNEAKPYNTADNPGGVTDSSGTGFYYASWLIDVSGLKGGTFLHFDLYTIDVTTLKSGKTLTKIGDFAPFSHDAQTVPEPGTILLLGTGLLGLGHQLRRRKQFGR